MSLRNDKVKFTDMYWLPNVLTLFGVIFLCGGIGGCNQVHGDLKSLFGFGGILACLFMCSLSVIVKAAIRYLERN